MKVFRSRNVLFFLLILVSVFSVILFAYRSLLFNMGTHVFDWNDYPLVIWIHGQNIGHILSGDIKYLFETNAFYPHTKTLLFTELMFPTSVLGAVFRLFTSNMILVMNILFFTTWFLNIVASYTLWKHRFSGATLWFAVLVTSCSPFLLLNAAHFQTLTIWPMLFALSHILFKEHVSKKDAVLLGVWMGIQFWSGVYIGTFLCFAVGVWWAMRLIALWKRREARLRYIVRILLSLSIFAFIAAPLLFQYWSVQQENGVQRESWEYVRYSADIADYIFTDQYGSLASSFPVIQRWNQLHKSGGTVGFPGIAMSVLGIVGMVIFIKSKKGGYIGVSTDAYNLYFYVLLLCGFIFSLGTRLNVNGTYLVIPLPYYVVQKLLPFLDMIRAPGRWALLFYFALAYFTAVGMEKIIKNIKHPWILAGAFGILYVAEIIPIHKLTEARNYYPDVYTPIAQQCAKTGKEVLLEYPTVFDKKDRTAGDMVQYWSQQMYASLFHRCSMINGYSGFSPKDLDELYVGLKNAVMRNDRLTFFRLLEERRVSLIKLNTTKTDPQDAEKIVRWLREKKQTIFYEDAEYLVVSLR